MAKTALVSSCLMGLQTRYDGSDNFSEAATDFLKEQDLIPIPICPEQLAGLPTPREKCWFKDGDGQRVLQDEGRLCNESGEDVTSFFLRAAAESCKVAELTGCRIAILKQRSPSCGSRKIHRSGQLVDGMGVTAAALKNAGLQIIAEDDIGQKSPEK